MAFVVVEAPLGKASDGCDCGRGDSHRMRMAGGFKPARPFAETAANRPIDHQVPDDQGDRVASEDLNTHGTDAYEVPIQEARG